MTAPLPLSARRHALTTSAGLLVLALLGGCGGDSPAGSGGGVIIAPTPSPTPAPTPSPSPTPSPTPTPPASWAAGAAALYDVPPDLAACRAGTLKEAVRQDFLDRLNALRALHGLAPVTYSSAENEQVDRASLMMAANRALSHTPPTNWLCYSATGAQGAASGNLIGGWGNGLPWSSEDDNLAGWMTERYSASIGHRRWILDPFLGQIAYGRVAQQGTDGARSDAATLKVFDFATPSPAPASVPPFVAYPQGDYPARYFGPGDILSFSAVVSSASRSANAAVNFSNATVRVSDASGDLAVTEKSADNIGYGLPNNLQWSVAGLRPNVAYTVRITGVTGAPTGSYQYSFRIVP